MSCEMKIFESERLGERYYRVVHASGLPVYVFPKDMATTHALFAVNYGAVDNAANADGKKVTVEIK